MKISKMVIENFRCAQSVVIDFLSAPQNQIVSVLGRNHDTNLGSNGVGKSTVFIDAPLWCLTGKTSTGAPITPHDKPNAPNVVSLFVYTPVGEDFVWVTRTNNPKGKNSLRLDDYEIENQELHKILGLYDPALLTNTVFFPQIQTPFVQLKPAEQSNMLGRLVRSHYWMNLRKAVAESQKEAENKVVLVDAKLSAADQRLEDLMGEDFQKLSDDWEKAKEDRTKELVRNRSDLRKERGTFREEENLILSKIGRSRGELEKADASLSEMEENIESIKSAISKREKVFEVLRDRLGVCQDNIKLVAANDSCPTCLSPINSGKVRKALVEQKRVLQEDCRKVNDEIIALRKDLDDQETIWRRTYSHRKHVQNKNTALKVDLDKLRKQKQETQYALDSIRAELQRLEFSSKNPYKNKADELAESRAKVKSQRRLLNRASLHLHTEATESKQLTNHLRHLSILTLEDCLQSLQIETASVLESLGMNIPVNYNSQVKTSAGKDSIKINITVEDGVQINSLSGGELTRLGIAVQMAVANLSNASAGYNPLFEVWDEPSTWLSEEGDQHLRDLLNTRATTTERTIFLIDHRDTDPSGPSILLEKSDGRTIYAAGT